MAKDITAKLTEIGWHVQQHECHVSTDEENKVIIEGDNVVVYWPFNSKGPCAFVRGSNIFKENASVADAVKMATSVPLAIPKEKRASRDVDSRTCRAELFTFQPHECYWCCEPLTLDTSTIDHVIPLTRGGTYARNNLKLSCLKCNNVRGDAMTEITGGIRTNKFSHVGNLRGESLTTLLSCPQDGGRFTGAEVKHEILYALRSTHKGKAFKDAYVRKAIGRLCVMGLISMTHTSTMFSRRYFVITRRGHHALHWLT